MLNHTKHWKGVDTPAGSQLRPSHKSLGIGGHSTTDQVVVSLSNSWGGNMQIIYLSREQARDIARFIDDLFMLEDEEAKRMTPASRAGSETGETE